MNILYGIFIYHIKYIHIIMNIMIFILDSIIRMIIMIFVCPSGIKYLLRKYLRYDFGGEVPSQTVFQSTLIIKFIILHRCHHVIHVFHIYIYNSHILYIYTYTYVYSSICLVCHIFHIQIIHI